MKKISKLVALLLAMVMCLSLVACSSDSATTTSSDGSDSASTGETVYKDEIRIGILSDPSYMEPNASSVGIGEIPIILQIMEGLVATDIEGGVVPVLATDWTVSEDNLTYTFNIKSDLKFSDGTDVEPQDWVWSFYRARDTEESYYNFVAEPIDTVEATETQVIFHLKYEWAPFIYDLANFNMVVGSKDYYDEVGEEVYLQSAIGTGPYMLESKVSGEGVTLVANPYYHVDGLPLTNTVKYIVVGDDNTRLLQLQSGQLDIITDIPYSTVPMIEADSDLQLQLFASTQIRQFVLNCTVEPFNDANVRDAVLYAIDKEEISTLVAGDFGSPVSSIVSEALGKWYNSDIPITEYDPDMSKQILADAGYTEDIAFTISVRSGSTVYEQIATLLKSQMDKAGFNVTIELLEGAAITDKYSTMGHQATILQWTDDIFDPSGITSYTTDYANTQAFYTGVEDEDLHQLDIAAAKEMDEETRIEMYHEIQQQIYDLKHVIPLFTNDFAFASTAKVSGLYVNPFHVYNLCDVTVAE